MGWSGVGRGRDGGEAWLGDGAPAGLGDDRGSFLRPFRFNDVLSRLQSPLPLQILFCSRLPGTLALEFSNLRITNYFRVYKVFLSL